jgi:hypothetical protein
MATAKTVKATQGGDSVLKTSRWVTLSPLSGSTSGEVDSAWSFQLSDLPNYTEFTNLYDSYRIRAIEVHVCPDIQQTVPGSLIGATQVWSAIDFDSAASTAILGLQQYDTCCMHDGLHEFVRRFEPRCALAAYGGAFTSYAEAPAGQWLDCASAGVQHYGFLMGVPQQAGASNSFRINCRYDLEFKRSR